MPFGLLLAAVASATPAVPTLYLNWEAPQGCPERVWMLAEVKRLRGELTVLEHSRDAMLASRATVTAIDGDWHVEIDTISRGVPGHRSLVADTCQRAGESAAVVLSLALANAVAQPDQPLAAPMPEVSTGSFTEPPAGPVTLGMALVGGGRSSPLPQFTPNAGLSFELILKVARLELAVFTPSPKQRIGEGARAADLWVPLCGELGVAVPVLRERVQLDFAADVVAAWVDGMGIGPTDSRHGGAGWLAFEGGAVLHLALWRSLALRVEGRVGAAVVQPKFTIDQTSVYDTPVLTGRVGAGVEWLF